MTSRDNVLRDALALPVEERAEVVLELLVSLEDSEDVDAEEAWRAELERRARAAHAGLTQGTPWREVVERVKSNSSK